MSEPKLISPMLDNFVVGEMISEHDGVCCYPAMKTDTQEKYILKIVSIPASQIRLQALLMTGAYKSEEDALGYFVTLSQELADEVGTLNKLASLEGFLPYEACQIVEKNGEVGLDVYLLSPYKRSLQRHLKKNTMTHLAAINLGLDLCACMALCRQSGYLYVDLKPSNIFLIDEKTFRVGDLGFMNIHNLKYASIPERYLSEYTAPEITDAFSALNTTIDIYSIGLILYQIYNGGNLPTDFSTAPEYADYELAEIIMKACDPLPANRWQDPVQMGQALKSYMQRNGVNDDLIIPPTVVLENEEVVPFEDDNEGDETEVLFEQADEAGQLMIEEMIDYDQPPGATVNDPVETGVAENDGFDEDSEDPANLSFLDVLVTDETAPGEETVSGVAYNELSDETSDILSMADDLIAMEVPPPVVAPAVSEIPVPVFADPTEETNLSENGSGNEEIGENVEGTEIISEGTEINGEEVVPVGVAPENDEEESVVSATGGSEENIDNEDDSAQGFTDGDTKVIPAAAAVPVGDVEEDDVDEDESTPRSSILSRILAFVLAGLILVCLVVGGLIFYRDYYLKTIDSLTLDGFEDRLDVKISSSAEEDLLTVICTDTYGNKLTAPVVNGTASFGGLNADTLYTITIEISGFHGLAGKTKDAYTTSPRTEISTFSAITGAEAGSVILSFTVNGQDSDEWTVTYVTDGESEKSETFTGHMITISGLTVGKTYTFTLESTEDLFVVGNNTVQYGASDLIYAENLMIENCTDEGLSIRWDAPAGADIASWTVLCYNNSGFSQTMTTSETSAVFTGVDPKSAYTVEVSASGMSVSSRCYMTENAITATNINSAVSNGSMDITWNYTGTAPESKWVVLYSYGDSATQEILRSDSTSVKIEPVIPGTTYQIVISLEDGTTVFAGTTSVETPPAEDFSGYLISKSDISFRMCVAPNVQEWTWRNVSTYKESFAQGEKAGFVMHLDHRYNTSPDMITTMYVTRNSEGEIVNVSHTTQSWTSMWYQSYGELEIPSLPPEAGSYIMDIYFNGAYVHTQNFTME